MLEVHDMQQGSPEWFAVRRGLPTASMFGTIMAKGRSGGDSKTRQTYLYKLAGERLTGEPMDNFSNHHMERGHAMEPEARQLLHSLLRYLDSPAFAPKAALDASLLQKLFPK